MANVVVTSKGTNGIYVDFGVYESSEVSSPQGFNSCHLTHIEAYTFGGHDGVRVVYEGSDKQKWFLTHDSSYSGSDFYIVDSIDSVAPTSQSDLIDKLTQLL